MKELEWETLQDRVEGHKLWSTREDLEEQFAIGVLRHYECKLLRAKCTSFSLQSKMNKCIHMVYQTSEIVYWNYMFWCDISRPRKVITYAKNLTTHLKVNQYVTLHSGLYTMADCPGRIHYVFSTFVILSPIYYIHQQDSFTCKASATV